MPHTLLYHFFTLFRYLENIIDLEWLIISSISLGISIVIRTEVIIFASIPISFLLSHSRIIKKSHYTLYTLILLLISLPWNIFLFNTIGTEHTNHYSLNVFIIQAICFILIFLSSFLIYSNFIWKKLCPQLMNILFLALIAIYCLSLLIKFQSASISLFDFLKLTIANKYWGGFWIVVYTTMIFHIIMFSNRYKILSKLYAVNYFLFNYQGSYYIHIFKQILWGSGSRILLHIMPIAAFYLLIVLGTAFSNIFNNRKKISLN